MLAVVGLQAHAQNRDLSKYKVEPVYEAAAGQLFIEQDYFSGSSPLAQYDNIIVINKAAKGTTAQTLRLYTKGQLVMTTDVSTGREDVEFISGAKKLFRKLFNTKGTTTSHWRHTTRGFYTVKRVEDANYKSGESGFHMPYAMFFNDDRGLAVHQVPPDLSGGEAAGEYMLGQRASSGCVRVHKKFIQTIHNAVRSAGRGLVPVIDTKTGLAKTNADGSLLMKDGFKTLVIVEEVQD